jgi:hypothetical protein
MATGDRNDRRIRRKGYIRMSDLPQALQDRIPARIDAEIRELLVAFGELCYVAGKRDGVMQFQQGLVFDSFHKGKT